MTAIITGATGDIGKEFVQALYEEVDSIWAVGKNEGKLLELKQKIGKKVIPVRANLADESDLKSLCEKIETEKPQIRYLINNAGIAKMGEFRELSMDEIREILRVNDDAATLLCRVAIPYMGPGSYILNIASASAFQPNPYISLYAASKAYLLSFTRAINRELKDVTCTAVCPGWVDTQMLPKEKNGKKIHYPGIVTPKKVVRVALKDCHYGKDVSICSPYYKYTRFYSKVIPHKIVMKQWLRIIKKHL